MCQPSCNGHPRSRCWSWVGTSQEVDMGLLDILTSIGAGAGDPRTRPAPAGPATGQAGSQDRATVEAAARQTGMGRGGRLEGLRKYLPGFVDQFAPDGRVPNEDEAQRLLRALDGRLRRARVIPCPALSAQLERDQRLEHEAATE